MWCGVCVLGKGERGCGFVAQMAKYFPTRAVIFFLFVPFWFRGGSAHASRVNGPPREGLSCAGGAGYTALKEVH